MPKFSCIIVMLLTSVMAFATSTPTKGEPLSPNFITCSQGKIDPPVQIPASANNVPGVLNINYQPAPLLMIDNGPLSSLVGDVQTVIHEGHNLQLNFPETKENVIFAGTTYQLIQFHVRSPAENQMRGQSYPLEIRFINQGTNGRVAVIGVFAKIGPPNPALQELIDHIPTEKGIIENVGGSYINPASLFPKNQSYYSFMGSLTHQPCAEEVQWIVMLNPITVSEAQVQAIQKATATSKMTAS